ncbi:MAG: hypothetical protein RBS99_06580 [Rhodospirillales bacterium]|jgi:hypothetical protein|nr:hypothetical protein [Rhodospirillales bacterium]
MRRKIGMSGGYGPDALKQSGAFRVYETPADRLRRIDEVGSRQLCLAVISPLR